MSSLMKGKSIMKNGYMGFRIDRATFLHAGNNNGWIRCYGGNAKDKNGRVCGSSGEFLYFNAYQEIQLDNVLITQVAITSQSHG